MSTHFTNSKEGSINQSLSNLKIRDNEWFEELYKDNRTIFLQWVERNHRITNDEALDIYQNTMIALFENVKYNKISQVESSVTTYIFGIAKNLIYKYYRKHEMINRHEVRLNEHYKFIALNVKEAEAHQPKVIKKLEEMKEPCKTLLRLFYVEGLKLSVIGEKLGYATVDVIKTQKSRCLKRLKEGLINNGNI